MANKKIEEIEGIGPVYAEKLKAVGIPNTDTLLERGCTRKGRKEIAAKSGIDERRLLEWVNMADLFRINGVGSEYADLLEAAGVDTVKELATRKPENLAAKIAELNEKKKLTRRTPTPEAVQGWVEQAKKLPARIEH